MAQRVEALAVQPDQLSLSPESSVGGVKQLPEVVYCNTGALWQAPHPAPCHSYAQSGFLGGLLFRGHRSLFGILVNSASGCLW